MAKGEYAVVNGSTRKIKKKYAVINGVTRKIKKEYVVVDGKTRLCWNGGGDKLFFAYNLSTYNSNSTITVCSFSPSNVTLTKTSITGTNQTNNYIPYSNYCVDGKYYIFVKRGVYYSTDLTNWTYYDIPQFYTWDGGGTGSGNISMVWVQYVNKRFVAMVSYYVSHQDKYVHLRCYESQDCFTWTLKGTIGGNITYGNVVYNYGKFFHYGNVNGSKQYYHHLTIYGNRRTFYSPDMSTWTLLRSGTNITNVVTDINGDIYSYTGSVLRNENTNITKSVSKSGDETILLPYDDEYFAYIRTSSNSDYYVNKIYKGSTSGVTSPEVAQGAAVSRSSCQQANLNNATYINGVYYWIKSPDAIENMVLSYSKDLVTWTDVVIETGSTCKNTPVQYEENL